MLGIRKVLWDLRNLKSSKGKAVIQGAGDAYVLYNESSYKYVKWIKQEVWGSFLDKAAS